MDLSTIIGIVLGSALLGGAIILGGNAIIFLDVKSIMIVLGGTLSGTMVKYKLKSLAKIPALVKIAFVEQEMNSDRIIEILVGLAEKARREGLLALEQDVMEIDDSFLQKGIQLVIDGTDPERVKTIMETQLISMEERHLAGRSIFDTMGQFAPAFGMIGTLIGLIQMLSDLDDPGNLGSGMAVALITTLYGALFANLFFIPMAGKLKIRSEEEVLLKEVVIKGILSIQDGENPRILKEKLFAFLNKKEKEKKEKDRSEVEGVAANESA